MKRLKWTFTAGTALAVTTMFPALASADSGLYLGAGIGNAAVEVDLGLSEIPTLPEFDENDAGYKIFGGYTWQLPAISLGIEGAYNDFGKPSVDIQGISLAVEPSGISVFGVAALGLGPIEVFGKAGVLAWDADAIIDGVVAADDGTDPAYGVGLRFNAGRIQIRGEYELYDVDEADLTMLSVGIAYRF